MKNDNNRFKGGDNLTGHAANLHKTLMQTELNGGTGGYRVSLADKASGISFGGNQMDLAKGRREYKETFINILEESSYPSGEKIFSKEEVEKVKQLELLHGKGKTPQEVFKHHLDKVNAALSSEYGRNTLDKVYVEEINRIVNKIEKAISSISNAQNREIIANSDEWRARLGDYENQFKLDIIDKGKKGKLLAFLSGEKVTLENYLYDSEGKVMMRGGYYSGKCIKQTHTLKLEGDVTFDDLIRFYRATDQYNKSESAQLGLDNRLKKADAVWGTNYSDKSRAENMVLNHGKIEVGDNLDTTIDAGKNNYLKTSVSANFNVDLNRLTSCYAKIRFDDHAQVKLNGTLIYTSIKDGGSQFNVIKKDGVYVVNTGESEVPAETSTSHDDRIDLMASNNVQYLHSGSNNITMDVIVAHMGMAYMCVEYNHG